MNKYKQLLDARDLDFIPPNMLNSYLEILKDKTNDADYVNFMINCCNGGYYYNRSLHIYSVGDEDGFNNILNVNDLLKKEYNKIIKNEFFFAQEIFGNQFGFSPDGIVFLNIETGEKSILGKNFDSWYAEIINDLDYYTGRNILRDWNTIHGPLDYNMRLCPAIPFVIGGEYEVDNLYQSIFPNFLLSNANIAQQIYDLPEGAPVVLKTKE
jgi:hypothetical protein